MKKAQKSKRPAELSHIAEALRPLAVPLDSLNLDPANARKHAEPNRAAIAGSLRVYGQRKPIVVNRRTDTVEAGNGTVEAARSLGWTHLAAVYVDDDPATAAGFAIADNRSAELAEWDREALTKLLDTVQTDDQELAAMLTALAEDEKIVPREEQASSDQSAALTEQFQVLVICADETAQAKLLERLAKEGYECKSLIS